MGLKSSPLEGDGGLISALLGEPGLESDLTGDKAGDRFLEKVWNQFLCLAINS